MPTKEAKTLAGKIWRAQIISLFPLLEDKRRNFIQRWQPQIAMALDGAADATGPFGEKVRDPFDAEWGLLFFLSRARNNAGSRYLHIPDEAEHNLLGFMRECRNKLAHGDALSMREVARILK